jgi:ferrochelatase
MSKRKRIAVVLASHGEAESARFIENYRVSLHTLDRASLLMHIPVPLRHFISLSSSLKKRLRSGDAAGGSPQNRITRSQAELLQRYLDSHPLSSEVEFDVKATYSASEPAVERVLSDTMGYDGQIVIPMSPVDNSLSCGLLCGHLEGYPPDALHKVRVIGRLWTDEALLRAITEHLFKSGREIPGKSGDGKALLLLFHGTLVRDRRGQAPTFRTGLEESAAFAKQLGSLIEADTRNPWDTIEAAYLNHDVGGEWTKPSFEDACLSLEQRGFRQVTLFAAGYFSDGNETIHRAGMLARQKPELGVASIPCLNDSPVFAGYLAGRVARAAVQILGFSGEAASDAVTFG